jgi:hypothetical protein
MSDTVNTKRRGVVKFVFWAVIATAVIVWTVRSYESGQMSEWFYHRAAASGYAVNVNSFKDATKSKPAILQIATGNEVNGLVAIHVTKGDRLPRNTTGVISDETVTKGRRVSMNGGALQVMIPWEMKDSKGFKFRDTFQHKNVETWPWNGLWNVIVVFLLGFSLGLMAEGFTDMLGLRIEKIKHTNSPRGSNV